MKSIRAGYLVTADSQLWLRIWWDGLPFSKNVKNRGRVQLDNSQIWVGRSRYVQSLGGYQTENLAIGREQLQDS